jgi:hypothetical protein
MCMTASTVDMMCGQRRLQLGLVAARAREIRENEHERAHRLRQLSQNVLG